MRYLRAGILMHAIGGEGYREDITARARFHQEYRRVLHGDFRAEVAIDPLHGGIAIRGSTLGHQIIDVLRPVLDGRVAHARALHDFDLYHRAVQAIAGICWRCAALNIVDIRTRSGNNQRALELAHVLCVDAEVGLQRNLNAYTLRHVDEAATAPDGAVQRGELIVRWGDDGAEMFFDEVGIQAQRGIHIGKDHAQLLKVFAHLVIDGLTLILGRHACQELALSLGNAQAVKGIFNFSGYVFPRFALLLHGLDIVIDIVEVNS